MGNDSIFLQDGQVDREKMLVQLDRKLEEAYRRCAEIRKMRPPAQSQGTDTAARQWWNDLNSKEKVIVRKRFGKKASEKRMYETWANDQQRALAVASQGVQI